MYLGSKDSWMKINNYSPSLSALPIDFLGNSIESAKVKTINVANLTNLLELAPGPYLISIKTPRTHLPKKAHHAYSMGFVHRATAHDVTYIIPDAIINVGQDTILDIFDSIEKSSNKLKSLIAEHVPIYSPFVEKDIDFIIRHLKLQLD